MPVDEYDKTWKFNLYRVLSNILLLALVITIAMDLSNPKTLSNIVILGDDFCVISGVI